VHRWRPHVSPLTSDSPLIPLASGFLPADRSLCAHTESGPEQAICLLPPRIPTSRYCDRQPFRVFADGTGWLRVCSVPVSADCCSKFAGPERTNSRGIEEVPLVELASCPSRGVHRPHRATATPRPDDLDCDDLQHRLAGDDWRLRPAAHRRDRGRSKTITPTESAACCMTVWASWQWYCPTCRIANSFFRVRCRKCGRGRRRSR
jgi:hypothetical protein